MNSFYNHFYNYHIPYIPKPNYHSPPNNNESNFSSDVNDKNLHKENRYSSFGPIHFKNPFFTDIEEPIFEILGIELYLDDIIILGLLFFLYQEGVQDELLFITLILLLLT